MSLQLQAALSLSLACAHCRTPRLHRQSLAIGRKPRSGAAPGTITAHEALLLNSLRHLMCAVQPIQSCISGWLADGAATSVPSYTHLHVTLS